MIHPKDRNMNRSRDVAGPKLQRPYDQEVTMKDISMKSDHFHDDHPTGTIAKHSLSDLHFGHHETPLTALGEQDVMVPSKMGRDYPDHTPKVSKGSTKDEQRHGKGMQSYPKMSKSVGKHK